MALGLTPEPHYAAGGCAGWWFFLVWFLLVFVPYPIWTIWYPADHTFTVTWIVVMPVVAGVVFVRLLARRATEKPENAEGPPEDGPSD